MEQSLKEYFKMIKLKEKEFYSFPILMELMLHSMKVFGNKLVILEFRIILFKVETKIDIYQ
jgi:hypothetical protein